MIQEKKINAFAALGKLMRSIGEGKEWPGYAIGVTVEEYHALDHLLNHHKSSNGWFTEDNLRLSFRSLGSQLTLDALTTWCASYPCATHPKKVALILAGNIPLVGFHDFLCVLMSGHIAVVKLSSEDNQLLPVLAKYLIHFETELSETFRFTEGIIGAVDAVIATGSDNATLYFERYFAKYPHIFRRNRTSVAVINGSESKDDLYNLGHDVFDYFGLGCRNVSHLLVPMDFDLNRFFEAILPFESIGRHHKYANNYDYNKAIYLLNKTELLDNGFVLLRETEDLFSPLSMLHFHRYRDASDVQAYLTCYKHKIQIVVGHGFVPFGKAQHPSLNAYADGIDTMNFLANL